MYLLSRSVPLTTFGMSGLVPGRYQKQNAPTSDSIYATGKESVWWKEPLLHDIQLFYRVRSAVSRAK